MLLPMSVLLHSGCVCVCVSRLARGRPLPGCCVLRLDGTRLQACVNGAPRPPHPITSESRRCAPPGSAPTDLRRFCPPPPVPTAGMTRLVRSRTHSASSVGSTEGSRSRGAAAAQPEDISPDRSAPHAINMSA